MAQVPYNGGAGATAEPDVRTPDDYQHIDARPEMFGGMVAQGLQQFGQGAVKASQFYDQVTTDDVFNQQMKQVRTIQSGDPTKVVGADANGQPIYDTGFFGLKGADALRARPDVEKQIEQITKDNRNKLQTPNAQLQFDTMSRRFNMSQGELRDSYAERANTEYGLTTNKESIDQSRTEIANNAFDDEAFKHNLADMTQSYLKNVTLQGTGAVGAKAAVIDATRDAWSTRIETIGVNDPAAAYQMAMAHQSELGVNYDQVAGRLRGRAEEAQGQAAGKAKLEDARAGRLPSQQPSKAAATAAAPNADNSYWIGDSIADGLRNAAGAQGDTQQGRNPDWVLDAINDADPSALKGKTIYLSSGAANAVGATATVSDQIDALKEKGVDPANIRLLGVGDRQDYKDGDVNGRLAAAAKQAGATFTGALDPANLRRSQTDNSDNGVHFADWKKGLAQVSGAAGAAGPVGQAGAAGLPAAGGPVTVERLYGAFHGQESGGGANITTSIDDAHGDMQITPGTFAQYAKPGERIDNRADNIAVGKRILADYNQRWPNDPARVAVAYFSGPGNVAPAGSLTPWLNDSHDGQGTHVSAYVGGILHRLGQPGLPQSGPGAVRAAPAGHDTYGDAGPVATAAGAIDNRPPVDPAPPPPPFDSTQPMPQVAAPATPQDIKAAALQAVEADPSLSENAKEHARREITQQIAEQEIIDGQNEKARKQANDKAADGYVTRMLSKDNTAGIVQQIARDPALTWETKEHLFDAARKYTGSDVEESSAAYGPGFWTAYKAITAPVGSPERVSDPTALLSRAGPDGDLTLPGVQKLMQTMQQGQRSVDDAAVNRTKAGLLEYAKGKLSYDQEMLFPGVPPLRDPKGEAIFNGQMIPMFEMSYDKWIKAGKDPAQFLTKDNVDKMVAGLRSPQQMAMDRMVATGEAAPDQPGAMLPQPPAGIDPKAWTSVIVAPPVMANGAPFSHLAWGQAVSTLLANPTPETVKLFNDSKFGKGGADGDKIIAQFNGGSAPGALAQDRRFSAPPGAAGSKPYVPPAGESPDWRERAMGIAPTPAAAPAHHARQPDMHRPRNRPPETPPAAAEDWRSRDMRDE